LSTLLIPRVLVLAFTADRLISDSLTLAASAVLVWRGVIAARARWQPRQGCVDCRGWVRSSSRTTWRVLRVNVAGRTRRWRAIRDLCCHQWGCDRRLL